MTPVEKVKPWPQSWEMCSCANSRKSFCLRDPQAWLGFSIPVYPLSLRLLLCIMGMIPTLFTRLLEGLNELMQAEFCSTVTKFSDHLSSTQFYSLFHNHFNYG